MYDRSRGIKKRIFIFGILFLFMGSLFAQDITSGEKSPIKKQVLTDTSVAAKYDMAWQNLIIQRHWDTISENPDLREISYHVPEISTDTLKIRLEKLNEKTPFNISYNPSLEKVIRAFLKKRPKDIEKLLGLSSYYFPMFETVLDAYNLPLEIKYLAIVESSLKPQARSRVGATGLWQFMFLTAKQYGLNVNNYVDDRCNPLFSTRAASAYLSDLFKIFKNWDLALAAYNSGPGNVTKAIRRSGGRRNYWNIRPYLPRETADYLPNFLATMYIFEYAEQHGYRKSSPKVLFAETDTIRVKKPVSFQHISTLLGIEIETLRFLNPSYRRAIIPGSLDNNYPLRLPNTTMGVFVQNEDSIYNYAKMKFDDYEKPLAKLVALDSRVRYKVKPGDYLGKIAAKFRVRVSQIKKWNNMTDNNIKIGQRLTIYTRDPMAGQALNESSNRSSKKVYVVSAGDSFWSISQKLKGVSIENLKKWNGISSNTLKVGTTLIISP